MKITSVEVRPDSSSQVCTLSFRDPQRNNPYNVKTIVGLDAEEIISQSYGIAGSAEFYNMVLAQREVIMRIELNPDFSVGQTVEGLRSALYKMIASSRSGLIHIWFLNELEEVAFISGFVSKFEAAHFSNIPEVQITVTTENGLLRSPDRVEVELLGLDPASTVILDEVSTAPHGFMFEMLVASNFDSLTIQEPGTPDWSFEVTPQGGFEEDDVLFFSSEVGNKHLYIVRSGGEIHLANRIAPGSIWPILFPGVDNTFEFSNPESLEWSSISHYLTYWGV